jgi:hypothetical protein
MIDKNTFSSLALLVFLLLSHNGYAQNLERRQPFGNWVMYFGDNKINDKFGIHSEFQARNYFLPNTVNQTLLRVGVNRYVNPNTMFSAGYAYIYTIPSAEGAGGITSENRLWQQAILRHRTYSIFLEHRYRMEQRYIRNVTEGLNIFDKRFRYRLQALIPLYNISPYWRHYFIAGYNELFMNLGRKVSGQYFDRNRFYLALGYQVKPKFSIQLGHLYEIIALPDGLEPNKTYNFQIGVVYNMDDLTGFFTNR